MRVVTLGAAVNQTLALPVRHPLTVRAEVPVAVFVRMTAAADKIALVEINWFITHGSQLVIPRIVVTVEAPELAVSVLKSRGMSFLYFEIAYLVIAVHEFMTIGAGKEKQFILARLYAEGCI